MSRRYMDCDWRGEVVRVTLGYDRLLDEFFLQVERVSSEGALTGKFVYVSSGYAGACKEVLAYFATKIGELGINIPRSLIEAVEEDAMKGRGNWIVEHFADETTHVILKEEASRR